MTKLFVASGHSEREKWDEIITYLDNELKVTEQLLLLDRPDQKTEDSRTPKSNGSSLKPGSTYHASEPSVTTCHLCGKDGHRLTVTAKGKNVINYFSCIEFVNSDCKKRMQMLCKKHLCFQCLSPGVKAGHTGACFDKYRCPHASHKGYKRSFHVLICNEHKNDPENLKVLEDYKTKCILGSKSVDNFEEFSKKISLFHSQSEAFVADEKEPDFMRAIYLTQTIKLAGRLFNLFYDNGCGDSCSKKNMTDFLASLDRAKCISPGPMIINGVSDLKSVCPHGRYEVRIPTWDGKEATFSGLCLDKITSEFPRIPLEGMENEVHAAFVEQGGDVNDLPKLPKFVGGETDLMIGVRYLKYFPKEVFSLPSGLTLYESKFLNADGSRGILAGPHRIITEMYNDLGCNMNMGVFFSEVVTSYRNAFMGGLDISMFGFQDNAICYHNEHEIINESVSTVSFSDDSKGSVKLIEEPAVDTLHDDALCGLLVSDTYLVKISSGSQFDLSKSKNSDSKILYSRRTPRCVELFEQVDNAGTEDSYRCVRCRGCPNCKKSARVDCISIKEEVESELINNSVDVDLDKGYVEAKLPFICDPDTHLKSNKHLAEKNYNDQVTKLNKDPKDKEDVAHGFEKALSTGLSS